MEKLILFGGTGHLGKRLAKALTERGFEITAVVRNREKKAEMAPLVRQTVIANVLNPGDLLNICHDYPVVISALGKSVSPYEWSKPSFIDVDFKGNSHILAEAVKSSVRKFVYVSAFHAERYPHLTYFRAHHLFSEKLIASGLNYSIVKPPALFSAFLDLIALAKKGRLVTLGKGTNTTNPIYEGDLAQICASSIGQSNMIIEAGGKQILTRHQINLLIQEATAPGKKVRHVPLFLVTGMLPLVKAFSQNLYDKMAFFTEVLQHDTVAPPMGETTLSAYLQKYQHLV